MTTVVTGSGDSAGSSALMFVLAILVIAAVGFGIYYFSGAAPTSTSSTTTINMPEVPAPSLPEAPKLPEPVTP